MPGVPAPGRIGRLDLDAADPAARHELGLPRQHPSAEVGGPQFGVPFPPGARCGRESRGTSRRPGSGAPPCSGPPRRLPSACARLRRPPRAPAARSGRARSPPPGTPPAAGRPQASGTANRRRPSRMPASRARSDAELAARPTRGAPGRAARRPPRPASGPPEPIRQGRSRTGPARRVRPRTRGPGRAEAGRTGRARTRARAAERRRERDRGPRGPPGPRRTRPGPERSGSRPAATGARRSGTAGTGPSWSTSRQGRISPCTPWARSSGTAASPFVMWRTPPSPGTNSYDRRRAGAAPSSSWSGPQRKRCREHDACPDDRERPTRPAGGRAPLPALHASCGILDLLYASGRVSDARTAGFYSRGGFWTLCSVAYASVSWLTTSMSP